MRRDVLNGMQKLSLEKASAAYADGNFSLAAEWLERVPGNRRPAGLESAIHFALARLETAELRWPEATDRMAAAVRAAPGDGYLQHRLALLRGRKTLLDDHTWATMRKAIGRTESLSPDALAPDVASVWACGPYYSRGSGRSAPWSRYIGKSKDPDPDPDERRAVFGLAGGYFCRFIVDATRLLAAADVVVPIPADPDRYATRMASLPDELARSVEAQLAVPMALYAVESTGEAIEMKILSRADRRLAAAHAFRPGPEREVVKGRGVLLVDDVITTGSTIRAAAALLRELGATTVVAAAMCHTEG